MSKVISMCENAAGTTFRIINDSPVWGVYSIERLKIYGDTMCWVHVYGPTHDRQEVSRKFNELTTDTF